MITVIITKQQQTIVNITISGHANSGEYGKDLVCAAVSATGVGILNTLVKYGFLDEKLGMLEMKSGYINIVVEKQTKEIQVILETLVTTLETIKESNTEFIEIKTTEV